MRSRCRGIAVFDIPTCQSRPDRFSANSVITSPSAVAVRFGRSARGPAVAVGSSFLALLAILFRFLLGA